MNLALYLAIGVIAHFVTGSVLRAVLAHKGINAPYIAFYAPLGLLYSEDAIYALVHVALIRVAAITIAPDGGWAREAVVVALFLAWVYLYGEVQNNSIAAVMWRGGDGSEETGTPEKARQWAIAKFRYPIVWNLMDALLWPMTVLYAIFAAVQFAPHASPRENIQRDPLLKFDLLVDE